jgi:uncharacterized protein (UPF0261 family)
LKSSLERIDMPSTIVMIGAFDTKAAEYAYLRDRLVEAGHHVVAVNIGTFGGTDLFKVDVDAQRVAEAAGASLADLRQRRDRGEAMKVMAQGAAVIARELHAQRRCEGIIGMGGTGGTTIVTSAMRALPLGVPKVCISTAASGNTWPYVGTKDVILVPSIVDVAGVNRISRIILARAAAAICGMVSAPLSASADDKPVLVASMFGNTTACVDACRAALNEQGYEVLVFHATGTGGRTMESLIDEGVVDGCLDLTTTEWADQVCGGVFDAGPDRLRAAGRAGIPHLIVPGCIDMVNFGPPDTVPARYRSAGRLFYEWNPSVTLMRTNVEENAAMGRAFASAANDARGPVAVLIPLRGVSILDGDGERFCDRQADRAMFDTLRSQLRPGIPVVELDCNINDPPFARKAVAMMLDLMRQHSSEKGSKRGIHPSASA